MQRAVLHRAAEVEKRRKKHFRVGGKTLVHPLRHAADDLALARAVGNGQAVIALISRNLTGKRHPTVKQTDKLVVDAVNLVSDLIQIHKYISILSSVSKVSAKQKVVNSKRRCGLDRRRGAGDDAGVMPPGDGKRRVRKLRQRNRTLLVRDGRRGLEGCAEHDRHPGCQPAADAAAVLVSVHTLPEDTV